MSLVCSSEVAGTLLPESNQTAVSTVEVFVLAAHRLQWEVSLVLHVRLLWLVRAFMTNAHGAC